MNFISYKYSNLILIHTRAISYGSWHRIYALRLSFSNFALEAYSFLAYHFLQVLGLIRIKLLRQRTLVFLKPLLDRNRLLVHDLRQIIEHLLLHILSIFDSLKQVRFNVLQLLQLALIFLNFLGFGGKFFKIVHLRFFDFSVPILIKGATSNIF